MITGSPESIRGHKMLAQVVSGMCTRPGKKCYRTNHSLRAWCVPAALKAAHINMCSFQRDIVSARSSESTSKDRCNVTVLKNNFAKTAKFLVTCLEKIRFVQKSCFAGEGQT